MGAFAGPESVEQGLALYFDAANPKSYPSTDGRWTDIFTESKLSLNNSPTFTTTGAKGFNFTGGAGSSNPYMRGQVSNLPVGSTSRTVIVWFNAFSAGGTYQYLLSYVNGAETFCFGLLSAGTSLFTFLPGAATSVISYTNAGVRTDKDNFAAWVYDNDNPTLKHSIRVNDNPFGAATSGQTQTLNTGATNTLNIGARYDFGDSMFKGNIYVIKIYNRALSNNEIKLEYNAFRGRFNI